MRKMQKTKSNPWLIVIALIIGAVVGAGAMRLAMQVRNGKAEELPEKTLQELYNDSVKDAAIADEDEILPLVTLEAGAENVTWDEDGGRVMLCTWHNYPDSYPDGENVTLEWGEVWTFTPDEMKAKLKEEKLSDPDLDMQLRFSQLLGMPPDDPKSTFTAFWANVEDIKRPAAQSDPANGSMTTVPEFTDEDFKEWYNGNILWSYFDSAYPWTRLGYTYDWADNGSEYGLTEFLVMPGSQVEVISTQTTQEFIESLSE